MARSSNRKNTSVSQAAKDEAAKQEAEKTEQEAQDVDQTPEDDAQVAEGAEAPESPAEGQEGADSGTVPVSNVTVMNVAPAPVAPMHGHVMDQYGNSLDGTGDPKRALQSVNYYPFEYETKGDHFVVTEDVYSEVTYQGSKRKGRALAFTAGTAVDQTVVDRMKSGD